MGVYIPTSPYTKLILDELKYTINRLKKVRVTVLQSRAGKGEVGCSPRVIEKFHKSDYFYRKNEVKNI